MREFIDRMLKPANIDPATRNAIDAALKTADPALATGRSTIVTGDIALPADRKGGPLHLGGQYIDDDYVMKRGNGLPGQTANLATDGGVTAGGTVRTISRVDGLVHVGGQKGIVQVEDVKGDLPPLSSGPKIAAGPGSVVARGPVVTANRTGGLVHFGGQDLQVVVAGAHGHEAHTDGGHDHAPSGGRPPRRGILAGLRDWWNKPKPAKGSTASAAGHAPAEHAPAAAPHAAAPHAAAPHVKPVAANDDVHAAPAFHPAGSADRAGVVAGGNVFQQNNAGFSLNFGGRRIVIDGQAKKHG